MPEQLCVVAGIFTGYIQTEQMYPAQKTRVISRGSENTFSLLQWLSMRKIILKHKK